MSLRWLAKRLLDGRFEVKKEQIDDLGKEKTWEATDGSPAHLIKKKPVGRTRKTSGVSTERRDVWTGISKPTWTGGMKR